MMRRMNGYVFGALVMVLGALFVLLSPNALSATKESGSLGKVMFVGDSITQGAGSGIGPGYRYQLFKAVVDNGGTYAGVGPQDTAGGETPDYAGKSFDRHNAGFSGWWASALAPKLKGWLDEHKPDTLYIMAGTNDFGHQVEGDPKAIAASVVDSLGKMIGEAKAQNPKIKVYVSSIPERSDGTKIGGVDYNEAVGKVNSVMSDPKKQKKLGYTYIDTMEGIRGEKGTPGSVSNFAFGDGLHPNAQGELIMAGNIARAMKVGQRNAGLSPLVLSKLPLKAIVAGDKISWKDGNQEPVLFTVENPQVLKFSPKNHTVRFNAEGKSSTGFSTVLSSSWGSGDRATLTFSVKMAKGGEKNCLAVRLGDIGLNVYQDRIEWQGDTPQKLYCVDMTKESLPITMALRPEENGIPGGVYVWLGDRLIAEAKPLKATTSPVAAPEGSGQDEKDALRRLRLGSLDETSPCKAEVSLIAGSLSEAFAPSSGTPPSGNLSSGSTVKAGSPIQGQKLQGETLSSKVEIPTTLKPEGHARDPYDWNQRHEAVIAQNKQSPPEYVIIGDSITHAWGGLPDTKDRSLRGADSWKKLFGKHAVTNMGFGFDYIDNAYFRMNTGERMHTGELEGIAPRVVVLLIGTNNLQHRQDSPETCARNMNALVSLIKEKCPKSKILVLGLLPRRNPAMKEALLETNKRYAALADKKVVYYGDIGTALADQDGIGKADCLSDDVHPNERGYELMAKELGILLKEIDPKYNP